MRIHVVLQTLGVAIFCIALLAASTAAQEGKVNERVYELRTYTTLPGRLPALHKRFAEHTMKLFEKHGMKNEGYWTPTDEKLKETVLIYIISHESKEAAEKSWAAFQADPEWQKVRADSEKDGKILAKPPEKVFMTKVPWAK